MPLLGLKMPGARSPRPGSNFIDLPVGQRKGKTWKERVIPESTKGKIALGLVFAQIIITLALEIIITVLHLQQVNNANFTHRPTANGTLDKGAFMMQRMDQSESVVVYHYIFMVSQIFHFTMTWDAIMRKNTLQLIGVCIFSFLSIAYTYIQSNQHANMNMSDIQHLAEVHNVFVHNTVPYEMTLIAITAAGSIFMSVMTWELYREFGWKVYKKLGADLQISRMYRLHQITLTFLKFDAFFFLAFSVQLVALAPNESLGERYVEIIVAIPLSIIMICVAMFAIHKESKPLLALFLVLLFVSIGYMIFKLVKIRLPSPDDNDTYAASRQFLTFFVSVTLVLSVISAGCSIFCFLNFGRGLLEHRLQHKLGRVAAPVNATAEEAVKISLMTRNEEVSYRVELD